MTFSNAAPGTIVNEQTAGSLPVSIASFDTAYFLVETPRDVSTLTFPFFEPQQVISIDDYLNLIGGRIPTSGPALVSYNSLKMLFENADRSAVYVVRVGQASEVFRINFPVTENTFYINQNNEVVFPQAGETLYFELYLNGVGLGEYGNDGTYLGIPYVLQTNPDGTDHSTSNNRILSEGLRDEVLRVLVEDKDASASLYVRSFSLEADNTLGYSIDVTPRLSRQEIELELSDNSSFGQTEVIRKLPPNNSEISPADYIQAVQTSFKSEMPQGFLAAPGAFARFGKEDRRAIGIAMENFCSDPDYSWMAIIDPGNPDIREIESCEGVQEFDLRQDYEPGDRILAKNSCWTWKINYTGIGNTVVEDGKPSLRAEVANSGRTEAPNGIYAGISFGTGGEATLNVVGGKVIRVDTGGSLDASDGQNVKGEWIGAPSYAPENDPSLEYSDGVLIGGIGYVPGTYNDVPLIGGSGYGARADITVNSSGEVNNIEFVESSFENQQIDESGIGYRDGDILRVNSSNLGGSGNGFSYTLTRQDINVPAGTGFFDGEEITSITTVDGNPLENFSFIIGTYVQLQPGDNIFPDKSGNNIIRNGIKVNSEDYQFPLLVRNNSTEPIYVPTFNPLTPESFFELQEALESEDLEVKDSFEVLEEAVLNGQLDKEEEGIDNHSKWTKDGLRYTTSKGFLAYYGPYLYDLNNFLVPPSGAVIGYAQRKYKTEGFQEPPAGADPALQGVLDVHFEITKQHQQASNPKGLNAIRKLPNQGIVIWGARTRSSNPFYRFINTRVILNALIGTAREAYDTIIFSSIDGNDILFSRIRETLEDVGYNFWIGGALFGEDPGGAYQVIVDRRNNSNLSLENGNVNVDFYVVPVSTLEKLQINLVRVAIGNIERVLENV